MYNISSTSCCAPVSTVGQHQSLVHLASIAPGVVSTAEHGAVGLAWHVNFGKLPEYPFETAAHMLG